MRTQIVLISTFALVLAFALPGMCQSTTNPSQASTQKTTVHKKKGKTPGKEVARGSEDIGKGAAKGSADLGKGVGMRRG